MLYTLPLTASMEETHWAFPLEVMELAEIGMSTLQTADSVYLYLLVTLGAIQVQGDYSGF